MIVSMHIATTDATFNLGACLCAVIKLYRGLALQAPDTTTNAKSLSFVDVVLSCLPLHGRKNNPLISFQIIFQFVGESTYFYI